MTSRIAAGLRRTTLARLRPVPKNLRTTRHRPVLVLKNDPTMNCTVITFAFSFALGNFNPWIDNKRLAC